MAYNAAHLEGHKNGLLTNLVGWLGDSASCQNFATVPTVVRLLCIFTCAEVATHLWTILPNHLRCLPSCESPSCESSSAACPLLRDTLDTTQTFAIVATIDTCLCIATCSEVANDL